MIFGLLRRKKNPVPAAPASAPSALGEQVPSVPAVSVLVPEGQAPHVPTEAAGFQPAVPTTPKAQSAPGASLADRVLSHLKAGATIGAIASAEGVSTTFVTVMVDDFERRGLAISANSLCSSGLGACGTGLSDETALMCAGCPLAVATPKRSA